MNYARRINFPRDFRIYIPESKKEYEKEKKEYEKKKNEYERALYDWTHTYYCLRCGMRFVVEEDKIHS